MSWLGFSFLRGVGHGHNNNQNQHNQNRGGGGGGRRGNSNGNHHNSVSRSHYRSYYHNQQPPAHLAPMSPTQPAYRHWQTLPDEQRDDVVSTTTRIVTPDLADDNNVLRVSLRRSRGGRNHHQQQQLDPLTPDALRSRTSPTTLRRQLQLSPSSAPPSPPRVVFPVKESTATTAAATPSRPFLVEKMNQDNDNTASVARMLPPVPSASWSLPTTATNNNYNNRNSNLSKNVAAYSPQVSTSGFYDRHSTVGAVAQSPHLVPNQTKTAVGALVAKQQQCQQQKPVVNNQNHPPLLAAASSASTAGYEADADADHLFGGNSLPPPPQSRQDVPNDRWAYKDFDPYATVAHHFPPSKEHCAARKHLRRPSQPDLLVEQQDKSVVYDCGDNENDPQQGALNSSAHMVYHEDELAYYPLDKDPIQQSRTPQRPTCMIANNKHKYYISPMTVNSSSFIQGIGGAAGTGASRRASDGSFSMSTTSTASNHSHSTTSSHRQHQHPNNRYMPVAATAVGYGSSGVDDYNSNGNLDDSFSRMGIIPAEKLRSQQQGEPTRYDFGSVHDTTGIPQHHHHHHAYQDQHHVTDFVYASDQTHVSAMSLSLPDNNAVGSHVTSGSHNHYSSQHHHGVREWALAVPEKYNRNDNSYDDDYDDDNDHSRSEGEEENDYDQQGLCTSIDDGLVSQKVKNQRRSREELVFAAVERLQDDIDLVTLVECISSSLSSSLRREEKRDSKECVRTDTRKPGFLTGFTLEARRLLSVKLSEIMKELNGMASTADFLVLSPTEVPQLAETHSDLYQALNFCRSLVHMAIPANEQEQRQNPKPSNTTTKTTTMLALQGPAFPLGSKWQMDVTLKQAMNLLPTSANNDDDDNGDNNDMDCSPRRQRFGGDSSVFTLPSESADTPMTSNLSLISAAKDWSSQQQQKQQRLQAEVMQVQRTIQVVAIWVERLSRACRTWLGLVGNNITNADKKNNKQEMEKVVQITREIKQCYLQLVGMRHDDLVVLLDAFDLVPFHTTAPTGVWGPLSTTVASNMVVPSIAQLVSCDEDEAPAIAATEPAASSFCHDSSFSPVQSVDMNSITTTTNDDNDNEGPSFIEEELDDLRRQVGSCDYDDSDGIRE